MDFISKHKQIIPQESICQMLANALPSLGQNMITDLPRDGMPGLPNIPSMDPYDQFYQMQNSDRQYKINNNYM